MEKLYDRIDWHNNTTPAINETNLNKMSKALDDLDDRVVLIAGNILVTVPELQEMLEDCTELEQRLEAMTENPPYIGENGHWYIWDTDTGAYVDSGIDASITVEIADITMLEPNATPYVTNTGTDTDPIFHLFIPRGQPGKGISSIAKTGTSGYVDTYTITYTDGTTTTYTVTNGRNTDQVSTIPTASASLVGTIYQYIGASTSSFTHGFYYECQNVNGSYQWVNIPVGNDPVEVSNSEPYIYRQGKGYLADMEIVGASVGWNQLVQNGNFASTSGWTTQNGSLSVSNNKALVTCTSDNKRVVLEHSLKPILNHKYLVSCKVKFSENSTTKKYNIGFYDHYNASIDVSTSEQTLKFVFTANSNDITYGKVWFSVTNAALNDVFTVSECNVIDLTQDFGSATIADHIYSLEQAQEGSGIAWIEKYGFFNKDYFAYDPGSIQSVCIASRKVAPQNYFNREDVMNAYLNADTGMITSSSSNSYSIFCYLPKAGIYTVKKALSSVFRYALYNNKPIPYEQCISGSFVIESSSVTKSSFMVDHACWFAMFCVNTSSSDDVARKDEIFDSVRVVFGLSTTENEYLFDSTKQLRGMFSVSGNELKANGDVWRGDKIQRNWDILSNQTGAIGDTITLTGLKTNGNIICSAGLISEVGTISGTTLTLTKAISGADFVYEKATPTTEAAQPYQNPQRAYIDGTEEFTDGLTRDVMIPVGNNTTYQQDKILPSVEDYVDAVAEVVKADILTTTDEEENVDLDTLTTPGMYFVKNSDAGSYNYPSPLTSGVLTVIHYKQSGERMIRQELQSANYLCYRNGMYLNGSWVFGAGWFVFTGTN